MKKAYTFDSFCAINDSFLWAMYEIEEAMCSFEKYCKVQWKYAPKTIVVTR